MCGSGMRAETKRTTEPRLSCPFGKALRRLLEGLGEYGLRVFDQQVDCPCSQANGYNEEPQQSVIEHNGGGGRLR